MIMDKVHFETVINDHTIPPIVRKNAESSVIRMGFPFHEIVKVPSFCLWLVFILIVLIA